MDVSFTDEKKYNEADIHSLKNVLGFSTVQKRFCAHTFMEGFLDIDEKGRCNDRLVKIDFTAEKFKSFGHAGQVVAFIRPGVTCPGTCASFRKKDGTRWILTCAHILVSKSIRSCRLHKHNRAHAYAMRQGEKAWCRLYKLDPEIWLVHPKFNGESSCGFDIAMCASSHVRHKYNNKIKGSKSKNCTRILASAKPETLKVGYKIELVGYPLEKDGWAYYHNGEIVDVKKTEEGGWVLFYNLDTTPGMSGSALMIVDERWVSRYVSGKCLLNGTKKVLIGVHTGYDAVEGLNFGTLITPALHKWIRSI